MARVVALDPGFAAAYSRRAAAAEARGDYVTATQMYRTLLSHLPLPADEQRGIRLRCERAMAAMNSR